MTAARAIPTEQSAEKKGVVPRRRPRLRRHGAGRVGRTHYLRMKRTENTESQSYQSPLHSGQR